MRLFFMLISYAYIIEYFPLCVNGIRKLLWKIINRKELEGMSFEKEVKIALIKKDWSQARLAKEMGISPAYLGELLKGSRETPSRIDQIKEILKDELETQFEKTGN